MEDIEIPCGQPLAPQQLVTKVHIQNIPPEYRNIGLRYFLEKVMQNEVSCNVELFRADGVATFHRAIGNCIQDHVDVLFYVLFVCLLLYIIM